MSTKGAKPKLSDEICEKCTHKKWMHKNGVCIICRDGHMVYVEGKMVMERGPCRLNA